MIDHWRHRVPDDDLTAEEEAWVGRYLDNAAVALRTFDATQPQRYEPRRRKDWGRVLRHHAQQQRPPERRAHERARALNDGTAA